MKTVRIKFDDEMYIFKNGYAKVPGCLYKGKPMLISLKYFKEMAQKHEERTQCQIPTPI